MQQVERFNAWLGLQVFIALLLKGEEGFKCQKSFLRRVVVVNRQVRESLSIFREENMVAHAMITDRFDFI